MDYFGELFHYQVVSRAKLSVLLGIGRHAGADYSFLIAELLSIASSVDM